LLYISFINVDVFVVVVRHVVVVFFIIIVVGVIIILAVIVVVVVVGPSVFTCNCCCYWRSPHSWVDIISIFVAVAVGGGAGVVIAVVVVVVGYRHLFFLWKILVWLFSLRICCRGICISSCSYCC